MASHAASGTLALSGANIEYRWAGNPSPKAIVLLHEGLGSVSTWREFPERLAEHCARPVFVFSRRGYGRSSPVRLPRIARFMHDEALVWLPQILAAAGIGSATLVGHSDGASIAIISAGACPPFEVDSLVLFAPHTFIETKTLESIEELRSAYHQNDLRQRLARHHDRVDDTVGGWVDVWLSEPFASWDIREHLANIPAPVLAIQGLDDEYGTLAQVDAIASGVSGSFRKRLLDNCGHAPHRDQENACLAEIASFLDGLRMGTGPIG